MDREELEKDFEFLQQDERVLAILLFGSHTKGKEHDQSDIDICVVAPQSKPWDILSTIYPEINTEKKNYDVKIFEELSIRLKNSVIQNYKVLWARNDSELQDYLFKYRKIWNDQATNWIET